MFNINRYISNYPGLKPRGAYSHFITQGLKENKTDNELQFHTFNPVQKKKVLFTNARDELSIKEWCAHHLLLGFDCIYIFDHLSKKPIIEELFNFDSRICVLRIDVDESRIKFECIKYALTISKSINAEWMLYLDADEFLILNKDVTSFLDEYSFADLISINWLMFGTNNLLKQPDGLIISNFTKCERRLDKHVKSFVRPKHVTLVRTPHTYDIHGKAYNVKKEQIDSIPFVEITDDYQNVSAYIAHYIYQSEEVYNSRKILRKNDLGINVSFDTNLHVLYNDIDNYSIKEKYSQQIENYLKEREL
uniref:Glycosyltransferase family 92 protein n=1 Tax=viral metagenome TaxID=1070528 RepID=A0A6C0AYK9_9ZZZZ